MKKFLYVVLTLALIVGCVFTFTACGDDSAKYGKELIQNGSFESNLGDWIRLKAATSTADGVTNVKTYPTALSDSDKSYLTVTNGSSTGNFVQIYQEVAVKRNAVYKITASIKNISLSVGKDDAFTGGSIEILEGNAYVISSGSEINGDWITYTTYIKPKNTDTVKVAMVIGASDAYTVGTVAFDNITMCRVHANEVPADATVISINKVRTPAYAYSSLGANLLVVFLSLIAAALIFGVYYAYRKLMGDDKPVFKKTWVTATVLVIAGVALRLILAGTTFDMGGAAAMRTTLKNIVDKGVGAAGMTYTQYAPFEIYYLWIIGKICYGWSDLSSMTVMLQLFPIVCEGITIALVYFFAKRYVNDKQAALFGALYALLPVAFIAAAGGSFETPVLTMLLMITFLSLIDKDYITLLVASLITCLWSGIGVYVLPFIVAYELYIMIKTKDKKTILTFSIGWFISFWLFLLLSAGAVAPMFKAGHIVYIFQNYYSMMFASPVCVDNAFNLYALFGLNGGAVNNTAFWLNIVFSIILIIYVVSLYFKNFNRAEMTLLAGFFLTVMAVFSLNMSETALIFGLILLLMYIIVTGEARLYWVFGVLSLLAFVNLGIVMDYTGVLSETFKAVYFNKGDAGYAIANVISACTVLYYAWVVYDITTNDKRKVLQPLSASEKL